jgi:tripartite-type tricarboxylate transporter receptor subunit TctC
VLALKEVRDSMARLGAEPMPMRPEEFDALIRNEIQTNAELVKTAGIQAQ